MVVTLLALGIDPEAVTLFVQSDVPETTELAWLLTSVTPMGWLEKCVSYKDKVQQGLPAEHGLFAYPVLQAADILLYDADVVPVGQDQKQHLEITRDVAERFNNTFGATFKLPEPYILKDVAVVPGIDGRKMSKSYDNTIDIFDDPKVITKKCKRLVTDSRPPEEPGDPAEARRVRPVRPVPPVRPARGVGGRQAALPARAASATATVKVRLAELIIERFAEARERRAELVAHPERVAEVRAAGAERARKAARLVLDRAEGLRRGVRRRKSDRIARISGIEFQIIYPVDPVNPVHDLPSLISSVGGPPAGRGRQGRAGPRRTARGRRRW